MSDIKMINLKINNLDVSVPEGTSIVDAAKKVQVNVPTLCYHPNLNPTSACGICVVKIKGMNKKVRACATKVEEGMNIITHDSELYEIRKTVIELILSNHPDDCLQCQRNNACELQRLAAEFGVREASFEKNLSDLKKDHSTPSLIVDPQKCIKCGRCVQVCQNNQDVWALEFIGRGFDVRIAPSGDLQLKDSPCVKCGQCSAHCPVGAIVEKDQVETVWEKLRDESIFPVVQIAPAIRVAFSEGYSHESGEIVTKKLYSLLKRLGFKAVFDTNFSADLTIMEEGTEFVDRFTNKKETMPVITSCCPAWVDFMEKYYPEMLENCSSAKSPQQMMGSVVKTYYAEKHNIDPKKIFMTSIMPCTAKKYELSRDDNMYSSGIQDVDIVLTTRELVRMAKSSGINFNELPEENADSILGTYSGAGTIFGTTGGVMEAALRTAYKLVTNEELQNVDLTDVRGLDGIKEAEIDIKGVKVRIAVAHGLKNVKHVLDKVKDAKDKGCEPPYHFIEVMACRGGCISGGGQPYTTNDKVRKLRTDGLYKDDKSQKIRCSHHNPEIIKVYEEYFEKPNSKKAHDLLHTKYKPRPIYYK